MLNSPATYSNLENHPRIIRAGISKPVPKIRLDPRTGLPRVDATDQRVCDILPENDEEQKCNAIL